MDSDSIGSIILMVILVVFSAYFSATETAFSSVSRVRLKTLAENGNRRAQLAYRLSDDFDKLLSTLLIGNNVVNLTLATVSTVFFVENISKNMGATISTIVSTVVVLIFGEITPKSIAKESPEAVAMFSAPILRFFLWLLTPVNFLFSLWKKLVSKVFKVSDKASITEDELLTFVDEAQRDGGINEKERDLIHSAIEFNDMQVSEILTPRVDIEAVEQNASKEEIAKVFKETGFSRLPVYDDTIDDITGVIYHKDFYNLVYHTKKSVKSIIKPVFYITGSMKISDLLAQLQKSKSHIAVVADEYGGTEGIVTMEDILEELVGEIWDEHDEVIPEIQPAGDDTYAVQCAMDFKEFAEFFELDCESESSTVGGWVMEQLGKICEAGDSFVFDRLHVLVTKTEELRVIEIQVQIEQLPAEETDEEKRKDTIENDKD